jgi:choline kinase
MSDKKPTLLILAAGMGSRYGKLKQMDGFGPHGETIIDYSIYDAIRAGFGKIVFIIRDAFREDFETYWRPKLEGKVEMEFVNQDLRDLPDGFEVPAERVKPWGTAHAIWVAKNVICEPFGVINADDYYGVDSYHQLSQFLQEKDSKDYAVVAYYLRNTLSEYGTVNRGVCRVDDRRNLIDVKECFKIKRNDQGHIAYPDGDGSIILDEETLVSMNMWGFFESYFEYCTDDLKSYLENHGHEPTAEYFIPSLVDKLIKSETLDVKVLDTESDWFGVTYPEDKPFVIAKIESLIADGVYPSKLW